LNPIGAGDAVSAVFMASHLAGKSQAEAFADRLAAGSASTLRIEAASFDIVGFEAIRKLVTYEEERLSLN
jgi:fructose-1-phosphate kinase PfkB-like protein